VVFVVGSNINQGEGYQIAGSWVSATHYGAPGSVPALLTVHKDRTFSVSDGLMFLGPGGGKFSPLHGVWEHTGPKSLGGTALFMVYAPTGMLVGFGRARTALNFVDDPDHIEGLMYLEIGPPCTSPPFGCSDPLSPTATWTPISSMPPGGFPVSATRIHRVEMPD
jgi:hypothetical protein